MYHSITFGDGTLKTNGTFAGTNTWDDWHLIPSSRPTLTMPEYSKKFVDIPGMHGSYDLSDFLTGTPTFTDRTGSFEFFVMQGYENWMTTYRKVATFLHGKRMKMVLEDDPGYYYEGRFSMNQFKSEASYSRIVIDYQVSPFKYSIHERGTTRTVWDTFNFETDTDWSMLQSITVQSGLDGQDVTITIPGYDYPFPVVVTLLSGNSVTCTMGSVSGSILAVNGTLDMGPVSLGDNVLTIHGDGTVRVTFREGSL